MDYSQETENLIQRMCRNVEREDFELDKKNAEECILKTYDLFNLKRPSKIVWFKDIFGKFDDVARLAGSVSLARSAWSAGSAWLAGSARLVWSAGSAWLAWSAWSAGSVWLAGSAGSAGSARSAWLAGSAGSAGSARSVVDYDFDWFVIEHEYIKNRKDNPGKEPNENDFKYLEYSELLMKAKEYGLGYRVEYEDTLYLVPTPLVKIDSQNRFHSDKEPAIRWKGGKEFYYLYGVKLTKNIWQKIVGKKLSLKEILNIKNIEQRRVALNYLGVENIFNQHKDKKLIDKDAKTGDELYLMEGIISKPIKVCKYYDWSTKRVYIDFALPEHKTTKEFLAWKHYFSLNMWEKTVHA